MPWAIPGSEEWNQPRSVTALARLVLPCAYVAGCAFHFLILRHTSSIRVLISKHASRVDRSSRPQISMAKSGFLRLKISLTMSFNE